MDFTKVIENRRSIRHFNNEEVTQNELKSLIEAGILSPSAHNRQPWHFIIIHENKHLKSEIAKILEENSDLSTAQTCNVIKECSSLILVFAKIEDELMDIQSVGAAIENMTLKATSLNLGSLWIGYIVKIEKQLQALLKTDLKLIAALAIGKTDTNPKPRPRKTLEEVSEWY